MMVPLNYLWFGKARTCAINEQTTRRGVPLNVLVEASSTFTGTYDLAKLYTLLSGLARTSFSNLIAYEACDIEVSSTDLELRMLADERVNITGEPSLDLQLYDFEKPQQLDLANQITALLNGITMSNATDKLPADLVYIGTNATNKSMEAVPRSVVRMEVPGYKLSLTCAPETPSQFYYSGYNGGTEMVVESGGTTFKYYTPRSQQDFDPSVIVMTDDGIETACGTTTKADTPVFPYTAFAGAAVFLAYYAFCNASGAAFRSPWGAVAPPAAGYNTHVPAQQDASTPRTRWTWGVRCTTQRADGTLTYARSAAGAWQRAAARFDDAPRAAPSSSLPAWQLNLNYHLPATDYADDVGAQEDATLGIGPALGRTAGVPDPLALWRWAQEGDGHDGLADAIDWRVFAANYLYASGEAERLAYEVGATSGDWRANATSYWYSPEARAMARFYRVTARVGRDVDVLRLVVDGVVGLRGDAEGVVAEVARGEKERLERWARGCRVRYEEVLEEDGGMVLRIVKVRTEGDEK
ncbi:hypothetical protein GTA08_BOTSDO10418 [Botryosphaeria dothidea]|uniref:Uncharacterized protein n=1 Tax=Botryosphaeria dothidea TaxID=55169 RepID=A0A8H4N469_9PEZI|nr:hypothetical protein GTA08_BOTSDO10418 [Botryosphaeria dothidea]